MNETITRALSLLAVAAAQAAAAGCDAAVRYIRAAASLLERADIAMAGCRRDHHAGGTVAKWEER